MLFEYMTVSTKQNVYLAVAVAHSKAIETQVQILLDDNWANCMTTGCDLVVCAGSDVTYGVNSGDSAGVS
jgi:hypothetical protein